MRLIGDLIGSECLVDLSPVRIAVVLEQVPVDLEPPSRVHQDAGADPSDDPVVPDDLAVSLGVESEEVLPAVAVLLEGEGLRILPPATQ